MEKLKKIVYFDEQAAMDFLEIDNDGKESEIIKNMLEKTNAIGAEGKVSKGLLSIFNVGVSGNASRKKNSIIENQITSTLVSSFIKKINKKPETIQTIENAKLTIVKESPAYFRNLLPILNMIDDIKEVNVISEDDKNNFNGIKIEGIITTLDELNGYYDMIATTTGNEICLVRFNITGLRNNYNLNDFAKMNLKLYGIKVGTSVDTNITFTNQVDKLTGQGIETNVGADYYNDVSENDLKSFDIIDVILAGV